HVIGIDASEGYLEGARLHRSHPNIAYEHGDISQMRFDNGVFDMPVSTLALDVIPEIEQVVAEMKRVTRPGHPTRRFTLATLNAKFAAVSSHQPPGIGRRAVPHGPVAGPAHPQACS